jgi:translation initiation factor 1
MGDEKPFHNPFGALAGLRGPESPAAAAPAKPATPAPTPPPGVKPIPRAVVRMERAGRGGKDVTVVEQLGIPPIEREKWLRALKSTLGCGGNIEGEALVFQGDHRTRLPALLTARGVKKVIVG